MGADGELLYCYDDVDDGAADFEAGKRFAILPNVNGQKYTIGPIYINREEQGEFIPLPLPKGNWGMEINVINNKYFLSSTPQHSSVFVNKEEVLESRELTFGDNLSFGDECDIFTFTERKFKEPFLHSDTSIVESPLKNELLNFALGHNELIVSKILSYLPVKDLKSCRFVTNLWNEEAIKILKKRCTLDIKFKWDYNHSEDSMKLFRYSVEMKENPLQNWKIDIPSFTGYSFAPTFSLRMYHKLMDDLSWFLFNSKPHNVSKLIIGGAIKCKYDFQLRLKIVAALRQTLEELELSGSWACAWKEDEESDPFPDKINFLRLSTFTLSLVDERQRDVDWMLHRLMPSIAGVTSIQLSCCSGLSETFLRCLCEVRFPNLSRISAHKLNSGGIRYLCELDIPLKKLELFGFTSIESTDYRLFDDLLKKHSTTLESLKLRLISYGLTGMGPIPPINFPPFPNLRHLNIVCNIGLRDDLAIELSFPGGGIRYKDHFPSLKSLTLWPMGFNKFPDDFIGLWTSEFMAEMWKQCEPFYEMFFPSIVQDFVGQSQVVSSVQVLDIITQVPISQGETRSLFSPTAVDKIAAMFPNLLDKHWASKAFRK